MKKKIKELNLPLECSSAGLCAFIGDEVSPNSAKAAEKYGVDISHHRSRALSPYMLDEYDLFAVMTEGHRNSLMNYIAEEKIHILSGGVPDPYGKSLSDYELCAQAIDKGLDELVEKLFPVTVHQMTNSDIAAIEAIEKECFSVPWTKEGIEAELQNENAHFFVAEYKNEKAGYLGMHIVLDECYIANIAVKEPFRRKGIANTLLSVGEKTAVQKNCSFISLEVRPSNKKAIALYEKRGYNKIGERKNFYSDPTENALIMTKTFNKE